MPRDGAIPWVKRTLDAKIQVFQRTTDDTSHTRFLDVDLGQLDLAAARRAIAAMAEDRPRGRFRFIGRIDAPDATPFSHVVMCVNAFAAARIERLDFAGIRMPAHKVLEAPRLPAPR